MVRLTHAVTCIPQITQRSPKLPVSCAHSIVDEGQQQDGEDTSVEDLDARFTAESE